MRVQINKMTPSEAARFIRQIAETTASASQNWDNFEQIVLSMIGSAMDAARAYGKSESKSALQAPAEEGWQPIATATDKGNRLLLSDGSEVWEGQWNFFERAYGRYTGFLGWTLATYWMPLPPPPAVPPPGAQP